MAVIMMLMIQATLVLVVAGRMTDPAARRLQPVLIVAAAANMLPPMTVLAALAGWGGPMMTALPAFYLGPLLVLALIVTARPGALAEDWKRLARLAKGAGR